MLNQFSRSELVFGKDAMERLKNARVAVFGIGGVGGYTVEALARSGVGALDLVDDDKVCITNLNRQILATRSTVAKYKVDVARDRILDINPNCQVTTHQTFFMPDTADQFDFAAYEGFVWDVSQYPDINELYVVSDLLITDYSSVFFDYANLKRPILFYMYDLAAYRDDIRGFYLDLKELPGAIVETEEALIQAIPQALEQDAYDEKYQRFHARFNALDDGHASERVVKRLLETK